MIWTQLLTITLQLVRQPLLYAVLVVYPIATYLVWREGKRQYWESHIVFSCVAIGILGGLIGALAGASLVNLVMPGADWHPQRLVQAASLPGLYLGMGFATHAYVRRVHYPFWRLADASALPLTLAQFALAVAWLVEQRSPSSLILVVGLVMTGGLLVLLGRWIGGEGRLIGLQVVCLFLIAIGINIVTTSWQSWYGLLELSLNSIGLTISVVVVGLRFSEATRQFMLDDVPRGVSQGFKETFTRAFLHRQSS